MQKKNQIAVAKTIAIINSTKQKSIDNRSNQLNPNNAEYKKSRLKKRTQK